MMINKGNVMDLIPMTAADILRMSDRRKANVEFANARVEMFKSDAQKMKELADGMRLVLQTQCDAYKNHVVETFLDCDYKKVKVSKRIAKARKTSWNVCK
jgi:hypothetical protein